MRGDKYLQILGLCIFIPLAIFALDVNGCWAEPEPPKHDPVVTVVSANQANTSTAQELNVKSMEMSDVALLEEELYYDSLEYLACCVQAEAGNQPEKGKRLVVDVILNRVDSSKFPNDIRAVIEASGQFGVVRNGSINRVEPSSDVWQIVTEELKSRTNSEVLYFRAGKYPSSGKPMFQIGDHYFSGN